MCICIYFVYVDTNFVINKTNSPKGNDRSPDNKSSKYFEQFSSKRFINWSRAANSAVHGCIRPNFKLFRDYIVVLGICKNEEDPTNLQNAGARVLTSFCIDFSDAQGQLTLKSMVEFRQNLNIWLMSVHSFLRYGAKNKLLKQSCFVTLLQICEKQRFTIPT